MASMSSLVRSMLRGDKASLSRLITIIENDHPETASIMREVSPYTGRAHIIGITGFPGVGKSTTIDKLISIYRGQEGAGAVCWCHCCGPFYLHFGRRNARRQNTNENPP